MPENWRRLAVVAVVLLIALAGWAGCAGEKQTLDGDEDRPPIVVYEGSIHFAHGHVWQNAGTRKWTTHSGGRDFSRFEVYVIDRTNGTGTVCIAQGAKIDFEYELTAGGTKTLSLEKDQRKPVLSTADLDLEEEQGYQGRRLKSKEAGFIKQVKVDGTPCGDTFTEDRKIRVYVEFVY